jgi:hypothetical protein
MESMFRSWFGRSFNIRFSYHGSVSQPTVMNVLRNPLHKMMWWEVVTAINLLHVSFKMGEADPPVA